MKVVLTNPGLMVDAQSVRSIARDAGYNVNDARVVSGRTLKLAVEFDEQSESRPRKRELQRVVQNQGIEIDRDDIVVVPRWAASLLTLGSEAQVR